MSVELFAVDFLGELSKPCSDFFFYIFLLLFFVCFLKNDKGRRRKRRRKQAARAIFIQGKQPHRSCSKRLDELSPFNFPFLQVDLGRFRRYGFGPSSHLKHTCVLFVASASVIW